MAGSRTLESVFAGGVPSAGGVSDVEEVAVCLSTLGPMALALPPLRGGPLPLQARVLMAPKQRRHLLTQRPFDLSFRVYPGVGAQNHVGDRQGFKQFRVPENRAP